MLRDQPLLLNIVVSDPAGVVKGSGVPSNAERLSPTSMPYVNEVVRTGKPQVSELMTGRISNQPTIVLSYPVRNAQGALVGVLGLGLNLTRLQTLFSDIPLPEGSVVTLTDKGSRVLARSRDAELYIGKLTGPHPTAPRDVPRTQVRTALDNVERSYGNAVVDRGPWLLSVGIPTSLAATRAGRGLPAQPRDRRRSTIGAILLLSLGLSTSMTRGVETVAQRGAADRRRRSVAAASARRCRTSSWRSCSTPSSPWPPTCAKPTSRWITRSSRSARCARRCSRCSARWCARSGSPPSACWCPAWRTS